MRDKSTLAVMVGQVVGGVCAVAAGVLLILFRRWAIDTRLRWYREHFPRVPVNRTLEMIAYLFGSLVVIAFGLLLIVTAL